MVEKVGKTMGSRLRSSLDSGDANIPGPGHYLQDKLKKEDYKFSMGAKLGEGFTKLNVPGPGSYAIPETIKEARSQRFGTGVRASLEAGPRNQPGPGQHSPEPTRVLKSSPRFGFGTDVRKDRNKAFSPGPGTYALGNLIGAEGKKNTMHSTIDYKPEKKENSYKPGPGQYNPDHSPAKKKDPAFGLGKSSRDDGSVGKLARF